MGAVSVPSRGAIFLNQMSNDESIKSEINVSVPSRGAIFLNDKVLSISVGTELFPSPLGELYFLIGDYTMYDNISKESFRPLSGSYIS